MKLILTLLLAFSLTGCATLSYSVVANEPNMSKFCEDTEAGMILDMLERHQFRGFATTYL